MVSHSTLAIITNVTILSSCVIGLLFALVNYYIISKIEISPDQKQVKVIIQGERIETPGFDHHLRFYEIYEAIYNGAHSFLYQEYTYMAVFIIIFSLVILSLIGAFGGIFDALFTSIAFIIGACTSIISSFIGMRIGVYANARTALQAQKGLNSAFRTSFRAAIVMGFFLCSFGLLVLFSMIHLFMFYYSDSADHDVIRALFEAVAGFGLGGSTIGLFGRVGGGIFTKAADVGADLVGKIEAGIPEDDPRNPAVIADNVGDNVGDIAGMGADLFGSFAEASCAALVIASQSADLWSNYAALLYPLMISAGGIIVCFLTSFLATNLMKTELKQQIEPALKRQIIISTILMTIMLFLLTISFLPSEFNVARLNDNEFLIKNYYVFIAGSFGLWTGVVIGFVTEYYTSQAYRPVQEVAEASETGAATVIIYGLALGFKSIVIPITTFAVALFFSHRFAGFYGVSIAALGILSTLSICLTIDAYGPICDNAGGIAEMANLGEDVRELTDALDSAGNTTAAIGKGFAICSAGFVSVALFSGFVTVQRVTSINILEPLPFFGIIFGAILPYWFTSMTIKSVGVAALAMVEEVRDQFRRNPGIMNNTVTPDYESCIKISTDASLREMIAPGSLVILTPLIAGFFLGTQALAGILAGALVSGLAMAISSSNSGGAWDNAKKYVEAGLLGEGKGKNSDNHIATVIGDTVGDPLKDTSGPSINILIKLMVIVSLVFARSFPRVGYLERFIG